MPIEDRIIDIVKLMKFNEGQRRVYPRMVASHDCLGIRVSDRTVRSYMAKMAREGRLIRYGQRGGYGWARN